MAIKKTIRNGYHGLFFVVGTSRFFLFADFLFIYDLVIERQNIVRPPLALWLVIIPLSVSLLWSENPNDGAQTVIRIIVLALILPAYKYLSDYHRIVFLSMLAISTIVIFQSFDYHRPYGLHMNASNLGDSGLVFMAAKFWPLSLVSGVILSLSVSRAPLFTFILLAILSRKRRIIITAVITTILFFIIAIIQTPDRLLIGSVSSSVEKRLESFTDSEPINDDCGLKREIEFKPFGYGFQSFCMSTGQIRPHNVYILSVYELGILAVPFWLGLILLARKFPGTVVIPLLALGLITDELFGRPEGVYMIVIWFISTNWFVKKRNEKILETWL